MTHVTFLVISFDILGNQRVLQADTINVKLFYGATFSFFLIDGINFIRIFVHASAHHLMTSERARVGKLKDGEICLME